MGEEKKSAANLQSVLFELSHEDRLRIIEKLRDGPAKLTHISKDLAINTVEASRHLSRLVDAGLVRRRDDNQYMLENITPLLTIILGRMQWVLDHSGFFNSHNLHAVPLLMQNHSALARTRMAEGIFNVVTMTKQATLDAERYLDILSTQPMKDAVADNLAKARFGVTVRIVYPEGVEPPKEYAKSKVKVRYHPRFNFALKRNERWGGLIVPLYSNNAPDFSQAIVGEDPHFLNLLSEIFERMWEESHD